MPDHLQFLLKAVFVLIEGQIWQPNCDFVPKFSKLGLSRILLIVAFVIELHCEVKIGLQLLLDLLAETDCLHLRPKDFLELLEFVLELRNSLGKVVFDDVCCLLYLL